MTTTSCARMRIPCSALLALLVLALPGFAAAETYEYDSLGQLTQVTYDDGTTIAFTYDAGGNRLTRVVTEDRDGDGISFSGGANACAGGNAVGCEDNCTKVANADQLDADGDGIGNACECGDADKDGLVNTTDARLIQRCAVGQIVDPDICEGLCDANGDGVCNTTDARLVQRLAVQQLSKQDLSCAERP